MNNVVRVLTCENKFKGNVKPRGKIKDKVAHKVNGVQAVSQDKHDTNVKRTFHEEADAAIAAAAAMGSKTAMGNVYGHVEREGRFAVRWSPAKYSTGQYRTAQYQPTTAQNITAQ